MYFDYTHISDKIEALNAAERMKKLLSDRLRNAQNMLAKTKYIIEITFASLYYHRNYLQQILN